MLYGLYLQNQIIREKEALRNAMQLHCLESCACFIGTAERTRICGVVIFYLSTSKALMLNDIHAGL